MRQGDIAHCPVHGIDYRVVTGNRDFDCPQHRENNVKLYVQERQRLVDSARPVHVAEPKIGDDPYERKRRDLEANREISLQRAYLLMIGALLLMSLGILTDLHCQNVRLDAAAARLSQSR